MKSGIDKIKNHLELSAKPVILDPEDPLAKVCLATDKFQNQNNGLGSLDPEYTVFDKDNKTRKVRDVLKEINSKLPLINTAELKHKNKELFDKIKRNLNPVDNTLSNDLGSLPIAVIDELCKEKFVDLTGPTKDTIRKLIDKDTERSTPFELPISQIPKHFCMIDKIGNQVGPNIEDLLDKLEDVKLLPKDINDPELMNELEISGLNLNQPIP